ncbi:MAG TPA: biopolymer transporter ExbB, partial [Alcaligenes faecalis]|nr:biopolymer transporter ExbB [Alcaligenes faecalis]
MMQELFQSVWVSLAQVAGPVADQAAASVAAAEEATGVLHFIQQSDVV